MGVGMIGGGACGDAVMLETGRCLLALSFFWGGA
jgi:hypothetical protein